MMLGNLFRKSLVCREAVELVTDYLEGDLSRRERLRFERHLANCPHCREYLDEMRATIATLGRIEPERLTEDAQRDLQRLYEGWIRE